MENAIIDLRNQGNSMIKISKVLKCSYSKVYKICIKNGISNIGIIGKANMSEELRNRISASKKEFYKKNPDKHNWKNQSKFISKPCEEFKRILSESNIKFISEFTPLDDRFFSIDIAFPNKMIGIEINGNQHYEKNGKLKEYYQNRHDLIEKSGWKLHEIHFSICYNKKEVLKIIDNIIKNNSDIYSFDYDSYLVNKINKRKLKNKKEIYICEKCGKEKKCKKSNQCLVCNGITQRKAKRPEFKILLSEISELGYSAVGRKYGVSDNAIRKWTRNIEE